MADNIRYDEPKGGKPSSMEISDCLEGLSFPAERRQAVEYARNQGADERIINTMEAAEDREYGDLDDLLRAMRL